MGLDISAFGKLRKLPKSEAKKHREAECWQDHYTMCVLEDFKEAADDIKDGEVYQYEEEYGFRAGSYGGYNEWRNSLALLAGYARGAESAWAGEVGPFYELINFSDCEGTIGPVTSAKLAREFEQFTEAAKKKWGPKSWEFEVFLEWRRAFELAAGDGAVCFH